MQRPQFPGGSDELRRVAIDTVRGVLRECGKNVSAGDPLPAELVDVIEHFNLPLSVLVGYVHFRARGQEISAEAFARHCKTFLNAAAKLDDGGSVEPPVCPACHAYPMQRVGAFWICSSGRCSPRIAG